tara:strand:- start:5782 stop:5949 length:168 start_codon:yes stop_codon:yes gene_type:complete
MDRIKRMDSDFNFNTFFIIIYFKKINNIDIAPINVVRIWTFSFFCYAKSPEFELQ